MGVTLLTSTQLSRIAATLTGYRTLIVPISQHGSDAIQKFIIDCYNLNRKSYMAKYSIEKVSSQMPIDSFCGTLDLWHLSKGLNHIKDNIEISTIKDAGVDLTAQEFNIHKLLIDIISSVNQNIIETCPEYIYAKLEKEIFLPKDLLKA